MLPKKIMDLIDRVENAINMMLDLGSKVQQLIDMLQATQPAMLPAGRMQTMTPEQLAYHLDWDNHTVSETLERLDSLTMEQKVVMLEYEKSHQNRVTLVREMEQLVSEQG